MSLTLFYVSALATPVDISGKALIGAPLAFQPVRRHRQPSPTAGRPQNKMSCPSSSTLQRSKAWSFLP